MSCSRLAPMGTKVINCSHVYSHPMASGLLRVPHVYGPRQRPDLAILKFAHLMRAAR
jgi:hypothetical protein